MVTRLERRIEFEYNIEHRFVAGLVLTSEQVLAIRNHRLSIQSAFVTIDLNREVWLRKVKIGGEDETIKLLLNKREINKIYGYYSAKGVIIKPIIIERQGKYYKVIIGIGTTKSQLDKREKIKERDMKRRMNDDMI